jgi:D-alanyl-D-alanine carboxypeptidase
MRSHRGASAALSLVLVVLTAAACGGSGATPTVAPTPTPTPTPTPIPTAPALAACAYGLEPARRSSPDDWQLTLVDTTYGLDAAFVPPDLVPVSRSGIKGGGKIREFVLADLKAMDLASKADGVGISVTSAYRSFEDQQVVYDNMVTAKGSAYTQKWAAAPGHSEHQLGTAVDFGGNLDWLLANAWKFGFVMSYPPKLSPGLTCYQPETWHYRYFGIERAAEIHNSGLTTREWLWKNAW